MSLADASALVVFSIQTWCAVGLGVVKMKTTIYILLFSRSFKRNIQRNQKQAKVAEEWKLPR